MLQSGTSAVEILSHHLHSAPEPPSARLGRIIAEDLEGLVLSCLEKGKSRRPAGAAALREALAQCQDAGKWSQEDARAWWEEWSQQRRESESWHVDFDKGGDAEKDLDPPTLEVDLKQRVVRH